MEQFHALQTKSHFSSAATRALLLSTYIKWVNVFPETISDVLRTVNRQSYKKHRSINQTRAN